VASKPIFAFPPLRNPSTNFDVISNNITASPQTVDVQNLVGTDSAVTDLRMREKTRFVWIFLSRAARCRDHPQRLLGGLYRYAECSWTRCSTFNNMKVLISCAFGLKTLIHAPKIGVFKGDLTPLAGSNITVTTKMALMVAKLCRLSN